MGPMIVRLGVGASVFLLALDGGSFGVESRGALGVAVWWTLLVALAAGALPRRRPSRGTIAVGSLLAAFTALTGASALWADSAEKAFVELNRAALYLGVFVLAALLGTRANAKPVSDGIAIGVVGVVVVGLAGRMFPGLRPDEELALFLPNAETRLSYPVGYWNGLAMLVALGLAPLLRAAAAGATPWGRAAAVGAVPALAATVYLTSSRGAIVSVLAGLLVLMSLARNIAVAGATLVAAVGSALAIAVMLARPELVDGPLDSGAAASQGSSAAVLLAIVCVATGLVFALALRLLRAAPRVPRAAAWGAVALAAVLVVVTVVAADPVQAFERFKEPPREFAGPRAASIQAHLLSGGGSGRWQFWTAGADEFRTRPVLGRGAGSFEAWWAAHGSLAYFVRDAHSLYLEVLGELGLVGLALIVGALATGVSVAGRATLRAPPESRLTIAALTACAATFVVAAGIDWMWEVTVVAVVGIAALGLALAAAGTQAARRAHTAVRTAGAAAALVLLACEALLLLTHLRLEDSRSAARRGDLAEARSAAADARALEPWAASPRLQLALVDEQAGALPTARRHIAAALDRDPADWRLWLVAARLETESGAIAAARRSLARARVLNPRSPLLSKERT